MRTTWKYEGLALRTTGGYDADTLPVQRWKVQGPPELCLSCHNRNSGLQHHCITVHSDALLRKQTNARGVEHKGLGEDGEVEWMVADMLKALKNWEYQGGERRHVIFKSDG